MFQCNAFQADSFQSRWNAFATYIANFLIFFPC